jgi:hypothetical protein
VSCAYAYGFRTSPGSLAIFAAIRRASALLIVDFEFGKPLLLLGKSVVSFSVWAC